MSEQDLINRENYLKIVKKVWSLDDESMKFIEKRTTDEWQPPQEYKDFLKNYKYENQRYRILFNRYSHISLYGISKS